MESDRGSDFGPFVPWSPRKQADKISGIVLTTIAGSAIETRGLENCMRRHGDRLTNACTAALVRAGEVSQAEVNRRRAALGR